MTTKHFLAFFSLFFILFPHTSSATLFTLYDATQNNLPNDQPWLTYYSTGTNNLTVVAEGANLQTDNAVSAGFSNYSLLPLGLKNPGFPTLNSTTGFTLSFSMQLNNESHVSDYRSGFSVILLDENNLGVELGFWQDTIWSQSDDPLFQAKDEQVAFNTAASMLSYDLTILNNDYFLTQNDNILLTGELKDYSAFTGGPFGSSIPYSLSNYLFLGDNTSSASADVTLGQMVLSDTALTNEPVPEPSTLALLAIGLFCLFSYNRASRLPFSSAS